jgi:hypothetical protein
MVLTRILLHLLFISEPLRTPNLFLHSFVIFSNRSYPSAFFYPCFFSLFCCVSFSSLVLTRLYINSLFLPGGRGEGGEVCIDGIAKYIPSSLLFMGGTRNQFLNNRPLSLVPLSLFLLSLFPLLSYSLPMVIIIIEIFLTHLCSFSHLFFTMHRILFYFKQ